MPEILSFITGMLYHLLDILLFPDPALDAVCEDSLPGIAKSHD
jgi:hypothetical protein